MSQKQERDSVEVLVSSCSAIQVLHWSFSVDYSMFTSGKTSAPKEKPFSHTANIISKMGQTTWRKYIFPYFLLKWQEGKKHERKCTNNSCIKLSWYTSLLLWNTNPVIFSYWTVSAHMKTKINLEDLVTSLALKFLWEGNKLLLYVIIKKLLL